ncbi:MAG: hypothetical protein KGO81_06840, partial [Bacteroidota bacterium]|nr:hypothetical protein [Bacteroidota bacterium]
MEVTDNAVGIKHNIVPCFLLHKEYIDHDGIDFDEENEKPFSFYYPLFLPYREIKYLISSTFP